MAWAFPYCPSGKIGVSSISEAPLQGGKPHDFMVAEAEVSAASFPYHLPGVLQEEVTRTVSAQRHAQLSLRQLTVIILKETLTSTESANFI